MYPKADVERFFIYGELSEMGRWSKRRWRHAEGIDFSLFSPHKQEKPVSVCHSSHKHTPTHRSKTQAHAGMYIPHHIYMHTSHRLHHFHHTQNTQSHTDHPFSNTIPVSHVTHNKTCMDNSLSQTHTHELHKLNPTTINPSQTHTIKSSEFDWTD